MNARRVLALACLAVAGVPAAAKAQPVQVPHPVPKVTYLVQVEWMNWHSGASVWATVLETQNLDEAEWTYNVIRLALDTGNIDLLYPSTHFTFVRNVRVRYRTEKLTIPPGVYRSGIHK